MLQNYKQAVKWFTKTAKQGFAQSQYNLGVLYDNGHGVLQDYIRADMRFNIAAANGDEEGREKRDALAKEMTSDQLSEAQKMAREMVETNPKVMGE